ncbi:MAG: alpha/beta hydrolase [Bdellovibrionaceae bacterium]|nr:alpha/beta hydrolase [Pseudobdellovibrionaceae bacterium]
MLRTLLLFVALPLVVTPLLVLCGFTLFQEKFLFHPDPLAASAELNFPPPAEEIWVDFEGSKIHSAYFTHPKSKTLILYFHGNAGNLEGWGQIGAELRSALRANVWIMDYPGFGKSEGSLSSSAQMIRMGETFANQIGARGEIDQVYIFGRSIGTGLAASLAATWLEAGARPPLAGVILETPYLSMTELVHDYAPWFPGFLVKYKFSVVDLLPQFRGPILILHGTDDEIIPYRHGEELANRLAGRGSVTMIEVPGGHHNDLAEFPAYGEGLLAWWNEVQRLNATTAWRD